MKRLLIVMLAGCVPNATATATAYQASNDIVSAPITYAEGLELLTEDELAKPHALYDCRRSAHRECNGCWSACGAWVPEKYMLDVGPTGMDRIAWNCQRCYRTERDPGDPIFELCQCGSEGCE